MWAKLSSQGEVPCATVGSPNRAVSRHASRLDKPAVPPVAGRAGEGVFPARTPQATESDGQTSPALKGRNSRRRACYLAATGRKMWAKISPEGEVACATVGSPNRAVSRHASRLDRPAVPPVAGRAGEGVLPARTAQATESDGQTSPALKGRNSRRRACYLAATGRKMWAKLSPEGEVACATVGSPNRAVSRHASRLDRPAVPPVAGRRRVGGTCLAWRPRRPGFTLPRPLPEREGSVGRSPRPTGGSPSNTPFPSREGRGEGRATCPLGPAEEGGDVPGFVIIISPSVPMATSLGVPGVVCENKEAKRDHLLVLLPRFAAARPSSA